MPVVSGTASLPANSVNDNVLAGSQYEFLPFDASIEFGLCGDTNAADLRLDVFSGQDVLMENGTVSAANRVPVYPDDFILTDVAAAGERIKVRVRNLAAAPRSLFFQIRITPLV